MKIFLKGYGKGYYVTRPSDLKIFSWPSALITSTFSLKAREIAIISRLPPHRSCSTLLQ
jgi:hypothetical protein